MTVRIVVYFEQKRMDPYHSKNACLSMELSNRVLTTIFAFQFYASAAINFKTFLQRTQKTHIHNNNAVENKIGCE